VRALAETYGQRSLRILMAGVAEPERDPIRRAGPASRPEALRQESQVGASATFGAATA
jgi:hypothetical protein